MRYEPMSSMPTSLIQARTLSSYTRARSAPKKSMDCPSKVRTSTSTSCALTPSALKMPHATPTRSSKVGDQ